MFEKQTRPQQSEPGAPDAHLSTPDELAGFAEQRGRINAAISGELDLTLQTNAEFVERDEETGIDKLSLYLPYAKGVGVFNIATRTDEEGNRAAMLSYAWTGRGGNRSNDAYWQFTDGPNQEPHLQRCIKDPKTNELTLDVSADTRQIGDTISMADIGNLGSALPDILANSRPEKPQAKRGRLRAFAGRAIGKHAPLFPDHVPDFTAAKYANPPHDPYRSKTPDYPPDFNKVPFTPEAATASNAVNGSAEAEANRDFQPQPKAKAEASAGADAEQEQTTSLRQAAGVLKTKFAEGYHAAKARTLTPENKERLLQVGKNTVSLAKVIMEKALDGKLQSGSRSSAAEGGKKLQHLFDGLAASIDEQPVNYKQDKAAALEIIGKVAANILNDPKQRDPNGSKRLRSAELAMELVLTAQDHKALREKHKDPRVAASIAGLNAAARLLKTHHQRKQG